MNPRSPILHAIVAFVLTVVPVDLVANWTIALSAAALAAIIRGVYVHITNGRRGTPTSWTAEGWGTVAMLIATAIGFVPGYFLPSMVFSRLTAFGSSPPGYERIGAPNRAGSLVTALVNAWAILVSIYATAILGDRHPELGLFACVGAIAGVFLGIAVG